MAVGPGLPAGAQARPGLLVIADSVMLGAAGALPGVFPERDVEVVGRPAVFTDHAVTEYVAPRAHVPDVVVVATGYNYPYWDPARFDQSVDDMIAALEARGVLALTPPPPPAGSAASVTVTVTGAAADGYATVFPCHQPAPLASDLNYRAGTSVAASTLAGLDPSGRFCVTTSAAADVVVDLTGFVDASTFAGRAPIRIADTRNG